MDHGARALSKMGSFLLSRRVSRCRSYVFSFFHGVKSQWDSFPGNCLFETSVLKRNGHGQVYSADRGMMGTTVLCIRKHDTVVIIGDGQVTIGSEIIKPNVRKVRRIGDNVIGGFAGATADAFTLFERLEAKLEEHPGQLTRAAVELAKAWRTDKYLRRLDALMVVADAETSLTITGNGDVLEPYDGVVGIGSGGSYATAAARALMDLPNMDAETIARKAMKIAADCCIYTNHNFTIECIQAASARSPEAESQAASISTPLAEAPSPDSQV